MGVYGMSLRMKYRVEDGRWLCCDRSFEESSKPVWHGARCDGAEGQNDAKRVAVRNANDNSLDDGRTHESLNLPFSLMTASFV